MRGEPSPAALRSATTDKLKRALSAFRRGDFKAARNLLPWLMDRETRGRAWHLYRACCTLRQLATRCEADAFLRSTVPAAFHEDGFAPELYPNPETLAAVVAHGLPENGEERSDFRGGVLLHGATGSGKTRAAFALLSALVREDLALDLRFKYVSAPVLKRRLADAARGGKSHVILEELLDEPGQVLFIDDLSQARFTPAFAENLFELVDRIHREQRPLVVTVQTSGAELVEKWVADDRALLDTAQAIARRLREYCVPFHFPNVRASHRAKGAAA